MPWPASLRGLVLPKVRHPEQRLCEIILHRAPEPKPDSHELPQRILRQDHVPLDPYEQIRRIRRHGHYLQLPRVLHQEKHSRQVQEH